MKSQKDQRISDLNFYYVDGCDCSYNSYYACQNGSNCCDNDFCRCGTIVDAVVTSVPLMESFVHKISKIYPIESNLDKYAYERLSSLYGAWDHNNFSVNVCPGYYGEEIEGVSFDKAKELEEAVVKYNKLTKNRERIEYLLIAEYGSLLPIVQNKTWRIKKLKRSEIIIGNQEHFKKVDKIARYEKYSLPKGICIEENDKYRLIDGYHRLFASSDVELKMIVGS